MDLGSVMAVATQLISELGGQAAGSAAASLDKDTVMKLIQGVMDEYGRINVPKLKELLLAKQKDTQLAGVKDDPQYRAQQSSADASLNDIIQGGGLTLADRAALNSIQAKAARNASAANAGVANQMAARGTLDSGAQLGMELANNQNSAELASQAGESAAGQAQARAYAAIQERARQAGAGLDRTYRQNANAATAQDSINRYNSDIANTAAKYNSSIPQADFNNQLTLANAKAQPAYNLASVYAGNAIQKQQQGNAAGAAVGQAVGAFANKATDSYNGQSSDSNSYASRGSPSDLSGGSTDSLTGESTRPPAQHDQTPPSGYYQSGQNPDGSPHFSKLPQDLGQNF